MTSQKSAVKSRSVRTEFRQAGFGLLEALVALVLLSSIGFTLLSWVQQNLDSMQRMKGFYAEQEARRTVAEWAYALNPMEKPDGEVRFGSIRLIWKSELKGEKVAQTGYPQGVGLYDVALYDVSLAVFRKSESTPWFEETLTAVGHKKVRDLGNPFGNN